MKHPVSISPVKFAIISLLIVVMFVTLHLLSQYARYTPFDFPLRFRVDRLFHLGREANIPAWYSTVLLLVSAGLLAMIGFVRWQQKTRFRVHWVSLSVIFVYLSMDEAAMVHEEIGNLLGTQFPDSVFRFGWVVFGAIILVLFLVAYLRFWLALPVKTKKLFFIAGVVFVIGAIGVEILAMPYENGRPYDFTSAILVALEEFMEMAGIVIFIAALLDYIQTHLTGVTFVVSKPVNGILKG
jgi:hypothetical protein